jgi:hypothetical protein
VGDLFVVVGGIYLRWFYDWENQRFIFP